MFRGNHPAKVDDKGRLKLPAAFKELLDKQNVTGFYITSEDGNAAQIWPLPFWEEIEDSFEDSAFDDAVRKYMTVTSYYGQQVEVDTQGRVLLPQLLRTKAALNSDVAVFGKGKCLEVVNLSNFEQDLSSIEITANDRKALSDIRKAKAAEKARAAGN